MKSNQMTLRNLCLCIFISFLQLFLSSCSSGLVRNSSDAGQKIVSLDNGTILNIRWNGSGDKIAFTNKKVAETQILVYEIPTGTSKGLISGGNLLVEDWYPTDKMILFSEHIANPDNKPQPGMWTLNLANGETEFLVSGDHAALSPDGKELAVLDSTDRLISIRLINLNTRQEKTIFSKNGVDLSSSNISWSPDGQKLIFDMHESGDYRKDLFTLDLKTSDSTRITESGYNYSATWSPDGKLIAYIGDNLEWSTSYVVLAKVDQPACKLVLEGTEQATFSAFSRQGALAYSKGGNLFYITKEGVNSISPIQCD